MSKFDEAEKYHGGDATTRLELRPGAKWEVEVASQEWPAILSEHFPAYLTYPDGEVLSLIFPHVELPAQKD